MVNIDIKRHTHWDRIFPADIFEAAYDNFESDIVLNENIQQWLTQQGFAPRIVQTKEAHPSKRFQTHRVCLQFATPEEAMLFKLTWC